MDRSWGGHTGCVWGLYTCGSVCVCAHVCISVCIPVPMHTCALVLVCSQCERPCLLLQAVELPDSFSPELRSLLEGLLQRDVNRRLGCMGRG